RFRSSIRADEVTANCQRLERHITNALGIADLTTEDLAELADLVEQIQALAESGELDGASLEFAWNGSELGIRREGEEAFSYVDLTGPQGQQGEQGERGERGESGADGRGLELHLDGTQLGVRLEG